MSSCWDLLETGKFPTRRSCREARNLLSLSTHPQNLSLDHADYDPYVQAQHHRQRRVQPRRDGGLAADGERPHRHVPCQSLLVHGAARGSFTPGMKS